MTLLNVFEIMKFVSNCDLLLNSFEIGDNEQY